MYLPIIIRQALNISTFTSRRDKYIYYPQYVLNDSLDVPKHLAALPFS